MPDDPTVEDRKFLRDLRTSTDKTRELIAKSSQDYCRVARTHCAVRPASDDGQLARSEPLGLVGYLVPERSRRRDSRWSVIEHLRSYRPALAKDLDVVNR